VFSVELLVFPVIRSILTLSFLMSNVPVVVSSLFPSVSVEFEGVAVSYFAAEVCAVEF